MIIRHLLSVICYPLFAVSSWLLTIQKSSFVILLSLITYHSSLIAQTPFVPLNDDTYHLIERFELKQGHLSDKFVTTVKPFQRKAVISLIDSIYQNNTIPLNTRDFFNLEYLRDDSWNYTTKPTRESTKTLWRHFYKKPSDLYVYQDKEVDLHLSPVTQFIWGTENNTPTALWLTARGVEMQGQIGKKLGFYTYITDTQTGMPQYVRNYSRDIEAVSPLYLLDKYMVPQEGLAKVLRRTGADYMTGRGYITFNALKPVNIQFGHDRHFVGSGVRSLFLSDFSSPYLFGKITTTLGRFQYVNMFCSLVDAQQEDIAVRDGLNDKKYLASHTLSVRLGKNMQVSIFEAEILSREKKSGFDWNYLNPIIFYRFVESQIGSGDNAMLGFDWRWNIKKKMVLYTQLMLDEFKTSIYFGNASDPNVKDWAKKYAFQLGGKYIDAFGIPNLDLQVEYNVARPYTYSHKTWRTNYVHRNLPLAHPYGANFKEFIGIMRYQMHPRLTLHGTFMKSSRGVDFGDKNWGGNIMKSYFTRVSDTGNVLGQGTPLSTKYSDLRLSYMAKHNFFLDARLLLRNQTSSEARLNQSTTLMTLGFRLNFAYKQMMF